MIVCGLPAASSVIVTDMTRVPTPVGLKVMVTAQLAPGATLAGASGQVLVWLKSLLLAPTIEILVMVSAPLPALVKVMGVAGSLEVPTFCLPNETLVEDRVKLGAVPVPESAAAWGLPGALSMIVRVAVRFPTAVGLNTMLTEQFAPAPRVAGVNGHEVVTAKSPLFLPAITSPLIASAAVPLFAMAIVWGTLLIPIF